MMGVMLTPPGRHDRCTLNPGDGNVCYAAIPQHRSLRPAAIALMVITFVQIALGITVMTMPTVAPENSLQIVLSVVAHVTTAALTLAASVVVPLQIRRHVRSTVPLETSDLNPA